VVVCLAVAVGGAHAFQWTPFGFPPGDQGYTMEIVTEDGVSRVDIDIVDRGGSYEVTTTMYMEREEVVAGHTCVVIRMELEGGDELEFAVAENLPVPCFSRYGSGSDAIEARLIDVR
jgi:hypothetical protein